MNKRAQRFIAGFMSICMIVTMLIVPLNVYAASEENAYSESGTELVSGSGEAGNLEGNDASGNLQGDIQNDILNGSEAGTTENAVQGAEGGRASNADDRALLGSESSHIPSAVNDTNDGTGGNEAGALTMENYSLKWVSGSSKTVINGNAMETTPSTNSDVAIKAQLTYSCGGNEGVDKGNSVIRLPKYVYFDREGKPVGTVELSIPMAPATGGATSFNYTFDDKGTPDDPTDDEIVITNYKDIQPGGFFMKADIVWKFNAVEVANGYTNDDVHASFSTQGNGGGEALTANSDSLSTKVNTSVSVGNPSKTAGEKKENWNTAWGPKPEDADDYYYVVWNLKQPVNTSYSTAPYSVIFEEMPGAIDKDGNVTPGDANTGEVVAWANYSYYSGGKPTAYGTGTASDFKVGTKEEMDAEAVVNNPDRLSMNSVSAYVGRDVVMRYPKDNIPAQGETPTVNNGFRSKVITADGEITEKVALGAYTYQRVSIDVSYGGDSFSMYKRQRASYTNTTSKYAASFAGALNMLRAGKEVYADWSIDVKNMSWTRTENGTKTYDTVLRDGMMYVAGERLLPEDYELTKFYPAQYDVYLPAYDEDRGYFLAISADYENKYAPIKVEVMDAAGNWSEYGSVTKTGASSYVWTGVDGASQTVSSSTAVALPAGTQDIRYTHTDNAYGVEYRMGLYYKLKPSEHLMGLIGADTTNFNLININEAWGAQEDADGNSAIYTLGNQFNNTSTPGIKADVEASDTAEFGGTSVVAHDYAEHNFTAIKGTGSFSKSMNGPINQVDAQRVKVPVYLTWDYYYNFKALGINIEDAIAANIINESREADFYDLLPPGVDVDMSSIVVKTYCTTNVDKQKMPNCDYTVEMHDNWRGSGRTMMIIHVKAPEGYRNFDNSTTYVDTGFRVNFDMYDSWDNIETNGVGLENNAAFYSKDGEVPGGVSDTGEGSADKALFENLGGDGGQGDLENNVKYKTATINVDVPRAAQMGFSKKVKGAADTGYSASTTVPATGDYSYQMRFALQDKAKAKAIVLYDVLETAHSSNPHWTGTFTGIDVSQITRQFPNADVKVYYSTSSEFGNLQATSGIDYTDLTNTALWSTAAPDDLSKVTALAVDVSKNKDGTETEFEGPVSLSAVISMKAPANYQDYVDDPDTADTDETVYAYNQAFMKQGNERPEGSETTKVSITKPDITITKYSDPYSGTVSTPRTVEVGSSINYSLQIRNNNGADAVTNVEVVDNIPDGLEIDTTALAYYFNSRYSDKAPADGTGRVSAAVDGQKVTFTIDKLVARENVILIIPVTAKEDVVGGTKFDNKAKITGFNEEEWDDYESNETHHNVTSTKLSLPIVKKVTGQPRPEKKTFTFVLEGIDGAPMPQSAVENKSTVTVTDGDGTKYFDEIIYAKSGTYNYTVTEVNDGLTGYSYDNTVHRIAVTVYKDTSSKLRNTWTDSGAQPADNGRITFRNEYNPLSTKFAIPVEKILGGDTVPQGHTEDFEFTLIPGASTNPMPADGNNVIWITGLDSSTTGSEKNTTYDNITFTQAGTYIYQIKETIGNTPGYTYAYDISTHTVTIKVVDNDGQLECSWVEKDAQNGFVTFKNNYEPAADIISLDVNKLVTGNDRVEKYKKSFTFSLSEPEYAGDYDYAANNEELPMPTATTTTIVDSGTAQLGQIAIKHAGTYTYTISEVESDAAGYTYDTNKCKAIVESVDRGGHLQSTITYQFVDENGNNADAEKFVNNYTPDPASTEITVNKTVTGNVPAGNEKTFTFKVEPEGNAPMPEDGTDTIQITGSGTGTLRNIGPYTVPGTYVYKVYETDGGETGYNYSTDIYMVTVEVEDKDGVLEAEQIITRNGLEEDSVDFENTYEPAPVDVVPAVYKSITGNDRPFGQEQEFTFTLKAVGDAVMPAQAEGSKAAVTDEGNARFGNIHYTAAGTYVYKITEDAGNAGGYTYSDNECTLTVEVTDEDGILKAAVSYANTGSDNETVAEFNNDYTPEAAEHIIEVKKTIEGNDRPEDNRKDFTFTLTGKNDAPMPEDAGTVVTITDAGTGQFGKIEYTQVGTYEYEVSETAESETGYTYSDAVYEITVNVTDNYGVLEKEVTYKNGEDEVTFTAEAENGEDKPRVEFVNEYHPESVTAVFPVEKKITGNARTEENKKDFLFSLTPEGDAPMPAEGSTAVIRDEGTAVFGEITYDKAGTFVYTVEEVNTGEQSYTYSQEKYTVTVTVTDNDGVLEKEVVILLAGDTLDGSAGNAGETGENDGNGSEGDADSEDGSDAEDEIDLSSMMIEEPDDGSDDGEGALAIPNMVFVNEYHPTLAASALNVEKSIKGDKPSENSEFSFKLEAAEGSPAPSNDTVNIKGEGKAAFEELKFTEVGTYKYTVYEIKGNAEGYTYDETVYALEVVVTDNAGELSAKWMLNNKETDTVKFVNTYKGKTVDKTDTTDKNKNNNAVKTGDDHNIILWALMTVIAACSLGAAALTLRRRKRQ